MASTDFQPLHLYLQARLVIVKSYNIMVLSSLIKLSWAGASESKPTPKAMSNNSPH